jgi:hypothetical protein
MFTPITLDKARNFRYNMKAISKIEKTLNTTLSKIDFNNISMEEIATVVWAGLIHEDKDLTVDKVMDLIDEHSDVETVIEIMGKALGEAFGNGKQGKN